MLQTEVFYLHIAPIKQLQRNGNINFSPEKEILFKATISIQTLLKFWQHKKSPAAKIIRSYKLQYMHSITFWLCNDTWQNYATYAAATDGIKWNILTKYH